MTTQQVQPQEVIEFWLGETDHRGMSSAENQKKWWKKDPAFDDEICRCFTDAHAQAMAGELDHWLETPEGRLAYILVLDQFTRNMFRGTPGMYAGDELAMQATKEGISRGHDKALGWSGRVFMYMPLMHSEVLADQEQCIALFEAFIEEAGEEDCEGLKLNLKAANEHKVIVEQFGRFPHRNEILGRASTPEEVAFLARPGSRF